MGRILFAWLGLILFLAGSPFASATGLPVPSFVYYGEVTDAFGWPFVATDRAQVIAYRMDGRECGRAPVDESMGPVINYRVEVAMTEPRGAAYAPYAVREGERITLLLEVDGARYPVTRPASVQPVGRPGDHARQDLALGHDADGDGLPDEWEQWLVEGSGGLVGSPADVHPGDDFDGDGVTNREEFLAGTDPAWDEDLPLLEEVFFDAGRQRVAVAVLTVPGRTYRILGTGGLGLGGAGEPWVAQAIARDTTAEPVETFWRGDGQLTWVYLRLAEGGSRFLKLEVR